MFTALAVWMGLNALIGAGSFLLIKKYRPFQWLQIMHRLEKLSKKSGGKTTVVLGLTLLTTFLTIPIYVYILTKEK